MRIASKLAKAAGYRFLAFLADYLAAILAAARGYTLQEYVVLINAAKFTAYLLYEIMWDKWGVRK